MNPTHVTLEPSEPNPDGDTLTVYFPKGTGEEQVRAWAETAERPKGLPLWLDNSSPLEVWATAAQPFPKYQRFQLAPIG